MHPVPPQGTVQLSAPATAVVIIPARFQSSRLPGKALADIGGRPMIEHVYRRAVAAARATSVIVATDDRRIRDVVTGFGGEAQLTGEHRSGTERLAEVAARLSCDLVVNLQGDEPLIRSEAIDLALAPFDTDPGLMMTTLRTAVVDPGDLTNPHVVKVVVDRDGFALYFSRAAIPGRLPTGPEPSHAAPSVAYKHIGLYVYRREFLVRLAALDPTPLETAERLEQLRALEYGYRIRTVETTDDPIGVDTPVDLERVRRIVEDPLR